MSASMYRHASRRKMQKQYDKLLKAYDWHTSHGYPSMAAGFIPKIEEVAAALDAYDQRQAEIDRIYRYTEGY